MANHQVNILLRLERGSKDPRVETILDWYDGLPVTAAGRKIGVRDRFIESVAASIKGETPNVKPAVVNSRTAGSSEDEPRPDPVIKKKPKANKDNKQALRKVAQKMQW